MAKLEISEQEQNQLIQCINTELKSAQHAQKSGKTPHIQQVYAEHVRVLTELETKVARAK